MPRAGAVNAVGVQPCLAQVSLRSTPRGRLQLFGPGDQLRWVEIVFVEFHVAGTEQLRSLLKDGQSNPLHASARINPKAVIQGR